MSDRVTIDITDGIADVRLNRPDKLNALDADMFRAIVEAAETVGADPSVRVVVLSGEGRSFCAGLDFQSFMSQGNSGTDMFNGFAPLDGTPANGFQYVGYAWKTMRPPVIAAVQGHCYGGGLQLALGADLRLAHPESKLSIMEIKWGLVPDMSITQTLRDLMPLDRAKELTWTGRIVDGREALELGLVTRLSDDPRSEALDLARQIADRSPHAVVYGKRLYNEAWHADAASGLRLEAELQQRLIGSPNQMEAVMANFEKRPPKFQDLGGEE